MLFNNKNVSLPCDIVNTILDFAGYTNTAFKTRFSNDVLSLIEKNEKDVVYNVYGNEIAPCFNCYIYGGCYEEDIVHNNNTRFVGRWDLCMSHQYLNMVDFDNDNILDKFKTVRPMTSDQCTTRPSDFFYFVKDNTERMKIVKFKNGLNAILKDAILERSKLMMKKCKLTLALQINFLQNQYLTKYEIRTDPGIIATYEKHAYFKDLYFEHSWMFSFTLECLDDDLDIYSESDSESEDEMLYSRYDNNFDDSDLESDYYSDSDLECYNTHEDVVTYPNYARYNFHDNEYDTAYRTGMFDTESG